MTEKIELHLHLEGAAPPDFIRRLAGEKGISLDGVFDAQGRYAFRDFAHFLEVYTAATQVLQTPDDFSRLTQRVLEESVSHGVVYTEIFLSPDFCGGRDLGAWREYLHAIQDGAGKVPGIEARGIITAIRHLGPDVSRETARCAAETAGDFITGFGLAGEERMGKATDFAWAFDCAREAGLGLTCHGGEFGGPDSVREALALGVSRLGHGVRAIEDPALVAHLAETGITLEVCPGSNVCLGVYTKIDAHPIDKLKEAGVRVTVSTDDPPFFLTDMSQEYAALADTFGWDAATFQEINRTAAQAAFCDDQTRAALLERFAK